MKEKIVTVYKIINRDGMFSTGGTWPKWSNRGKMWLGIEQLKSHLKIVNPRIWKGVNEGLNFYFNAGARVVAYELREVQMDKDPIEMALTR